MEGGIFLKQAERRITTENTVVLSLLAKRLIKVYVIGGKLDWPVWKKTYSVIGAAADVDVVKGALVTIVQRDVIAVTNGW